MRVPAHLAPKPVRQPMRVCLVSNLGWRAGGAETSIEVLRAALTERGHLVSVITTDSGAPGRADVFADEMIPHIRGGPIRRLLRYAFYRTGHAELRRIFVALQPDIVHFHTVGELSPSALIAACDIPHIMTVHGPEDFTRALIPWLLPATDYHGGSYRRSDLRPIGRLRWMYLRVIQRPAYLIALRRCAALVAPSSYIARALQHDVAAERIVRIANGIDLPEAADFPGNGRFVFVGRLEAVKGVDVLLRAFAQARSRCPQIALTIVGEGTERGRLEDLAAALGTADAVTFVGRVGKGEVVRFLVDADALVVPSVWPEAFGLVVVEAMGVGRAVLGTGVGAVPELVEHGVSGLITDPYDVAALAEGMVLLASQPDRCRDMGVAGRAKASAYTTDIFVDSLVALYYRCARIAALAAR